MSDPVTNVEIEDVLTSIRRLVSENGRASAPSERSEVLRSEPSPEPEIPQFEPESPQAEADPDEAASAPTRLMLTPALRVSEIEQDTQAQGAASTSTSPLSFVHAEAAEESADPDEGRFSANEFRHFTQEPEDQPEAEEDVDFDVDYDSEEIIGFDPDEGIALEDAQSLDSRIVQWENVSTGEDEHYEPDAPGDSDYAGTDISSMSWIEAVAAKQGNDTDAEAAIDQAQDVSLDEAYDLSGREFEETEPEEPLAEMSQQVEADARDYVVETVEQAIAPELEGFETDESLVLDEAMLREMVSDIVRQELQGALGERITRNVRKLVRREIHRALAAHDLE